MIWVGGRVVPDDALKVSVLDRTFEHGLGLFETLRTYNRRAPLLGRHLTRLERSARELKLPIDSVEPPDAAAVAALLDAEEVRHDVMLRITLTGGTTDSAGATLWMRTAPLPPPLRHEGAILDLGTWWVPPRDTLSRHKSLNYWSRRLAFDRAREMGFDEVLCLGGPGAARMVYEGSRTNVFVIRRQSLLTPSLEECLLPGVMRGLVLEMAKELDLEIVKAIALPVSTLVSADEVFLTNSVRGIIPVSKAIDPWMGDASWTWRAPGDWTQRLSILVNDWLQSGGQTK
jgi:branched-chain amino acid aminotransferase